MHSQNYPYTTVVNFRIFSPLRTLCLLQPLPSLPVTAPGGCCFPSYLFGLAYLWNYYTSWDFFLWAFFNRHPCVGMACIYRILSLWLNSIPWCGQTSCCLSIHPLLGIMKCFHFGAGVSVYAMNVHAQIFSCDHSFVCVPRKGTESCHSSV